MCALRKPNVPYQSAYSYGIFNNDAWGEAVRSLTGTTIHQYDCFIDSAPTTAESDGFVFHKECVASQSRVAPWVVLAPWAQKRKNEDPRLGSPIFDTLASQLRKNGHGDVENGQLLLKVDIEGMEWEVFASAHQHDLLKFRQIVIEFHMPYLTTRCDHRHLIMRLRALRNLLEAFVIVHVHVNNVCQIPLGACIEVSFACPGIVNPVPCHNPALHDLDALEDPTLPAVDYAEIFRSLGTP